MTSKPLGKLTAEQFAHLSELVQETRENGPELEQVFREADQDHLNDLLKDDFSWTHLYEMSFLEHVTMGVLILNWQDTLKLAAQADDPQQYFFDFLETQNLIPIGTAAIKLFLKNSIYLA
jgi:hypothetical protein